jgi:hypothetical protein
MTWLLNLALDLLFGKQEKIERYTGPQPIPACNAHATIGRPEGGDHEYVIWNAENQR